MDDEVHKLLTHLDLEGIELILLKDFEKGDTELVNSKKNRSIYEYYFTCTPSLPLYIFKNYEDVEQITYVDSDLFFYSSPEDIFKEIEDYSIAIIEHRYSNRYKSMLKFGRFNVGWLTFKNDKNGTKCLEWWRNRCIDWCYKRLEDDKFADQKYLDQWSSLFEGVKIIEHKGANLGTWNIENYKIKIENNKIKVDQHDLIFFHFHGFRKLLLNIYSPGYSKTRVTKVTREYIFKPFLQSHLSNKLFIQRNTLCNKSDQVFTSHNREILFNSDFLRRFFSIIYRFLLSGNYVRIKKTKFTINIAI